MRWKYRLEIMGPHTWPASVVPAVYGVLYGILHGHSFSMLRSLVLIVICILLQSVANIFNDLVDYRKGTDQRNDFVEQTDSILVYGYMKWQEALIFGGICLCLAGGSGLYIISKSGLAPLCIGVIGGITAVAYSVGPVPLSHLPLGEAVSGLMMGGLIPLGVISGMDGKVEWSVLLAATPLILGVGLIMMTNNASDLEKDRRAGRKTLAVLLGRPCICKVYRWLTAVWIVLLIITAGKLGKRALAVTLILLVAVGKTVIAELFSVDLLPENRIRHMKLILKANVVFGVVSCGSVIAAIC